MKPVLPERTFHFLIERSLTSIYERINIALKGTLEDLGHKVTYFDASCFESKDKAIQYFFKSIANKAIDYCIITSHCNFFYSYLPDSNSYLFELIETQLIFIHYEDISNIFNGEPGYNASLQSLQKVKDRSLHFCLEYSNFIDLRFLGFERVYTIQHGSEFQSINSPKEKPYNLSFVGHVIPQLGNAFKLSPYSHLFQADFWSRLVKLDKELKSAAVAFANQILKVDESLDFFEQKFFYISTLNLVSPCFRGELFTRLITRLNNLDLDIFGVAPGYLHDILSNQILDNQNIKYHSVTDYLTTQYIYANSKINLNITPLQFDNAVVNRVIDVGAVGGFILTDWKPGLRNLTSVHEEISYRTIDELSYKINYYLSNEEERIKITEKLHRDIISKCTYSHVVKDIISKICQMPTNDSEPIRLDLGCGFRKPEGFVGVDSYPWSEVDVIADLNETFPFPDNSVDEVRAHDIIEHLPDKIHTMNEIWRICKSNAIVDINVPSTDGRGAFQDPTHTSFWNINSFKYYCVEFPAYVNLCRSYGFQGAFRIISLKQEESPDRVIHVRAILQVIKSNKFQLANEANDIISLLNIREINLIVFPDWSQPEEVLLTELTNVIRVLYIHPYKREITLLIDIRNYNSFDVSPELVLSSIILNLSLNEGLDATEEGLEISLVPELASQEWEALLSKVYGRVILEKEDVETIEKIKFNLSFKLEDITNFRK